MKLPTSTSDRWRSLRSILPAAAVGLALGPLAGCTLHGTTGASYGYSRGYVVVDGVPPANIQSYPRYSYDGTYVYLVGDRWYRPYGGGWGYLS